MGRPCAAFVLSSTVKLQTNNKHTNIFVNKHPDNRQCQGPAAAPYRRERRAPGCPQTANYPISAKPTNMQTILHVYIRTSFRPASYYLRNRFSSLDTYVVWSATRQPPLWLSAPLCGASQLLVTHDTSSLAAPMCPVPPTRNKTQNKAMLFLKNGVFRRLFDPMAAPANCDLRCF